MVKLNYAELKIGQRYEQMEHYFKTGEYCELDDFFGGVEPFRYDFDKKCIYVLDNEDAINYISNLITKYKDEYMLIDI